MYLKNQPKQFLKRLELSASRLYSLRDLSDIINTLITINQRRRGLKKEVGEQLQFSDR